MYLGIKHSSILDRKKELILTRRHNAAFAADVIKQMLLVNCLIEGLRPHHTVEEVSFKYMWTLVVLLSHGPHWRTQRIQRKH